MTTKIKDMNDGQIDNFIESLDSLTDFMIDNQIHHISFTDLVQLMEELKK